MEFTQEEVPPTRNKKGGMGSEDRLRNSIIEVQYIKQHRDIFEATWCYGLVHLDKVLSSSQATNICRSITIVSILDDHIFIIYRGKRFSVSNQLLGKEFAASLNKRTPPECQVLALSNSEVVQFLRQPRGFLNPQKTLYGTITNQEFCKYIDFFTKWVLLKRGYHHATT